MSLAADNSNLALACGWRRPSVHRSARLAVLLRRSVEPSNQAVGEGRPAVSTLPRYLLNRRRLPFSSLWAACQSLKDSSMRRVCREAWHRNTTFYTLFSAWLKMHACSMDNDGRNRRSGKGMTGFRTPLAHTETPKVCVFMKLFYEQIK